MCEPTCCPVFPGKADKGTPMKRFPFLSGRCAGPTLQTVTRQGAQALTLVAALVASAAAPAQPSGGSVVSGSANISQAADTTTITAGHNSVLRWDSFDVGAAHTVEFVQPSVDARVLNWIEGLAASRIDGTLRANGHVYLVNQAGLFFGQTAVIDAARLYAVAGSLSKDDFLAGNDRFTNLAGHVRNEGLINASLVALVGRSVANTGSIVAPNGFVTLAAGDEVLLAKKGGRIYVETGVSVGQTHGAAGDVAVTNSGRIDAGHGSAVLAAGDVFSVAISHSGVLRGQDVRVQGQGSGRVVVDGLIDVSASGPGQQGGYAEVSGEHIQLRAGAVVDAQGDAGGGTILIGGDAHGVSDTVRNATSTTVFDGALLKADAVQTGDGGKIVVWSDDWTAYRGALSARGGAGGGNGGFAEVSGGRLVFAGRANLGAPAGKAGTLLLDPTDITINNAPDTPDDYYEGPHFSPPIEGSTISWQTLLDALEHSDVVVSTWGTNGTQDGNITVAESPLGGAYDSESGLTLEVTSGGQIFVNAPVINLGTGHITLDASYGGVRLNGTEGATIVGSGGSVRLFVEDEAALSVTGNIASATHVSIFAESTLEAPGSLITTATPYLSLSMENAIVRNQHDDGVTIGAYGSGIFDITSRNAAGTADAPLVFGDGESRSVYDQVRLWGSDLSIPEWLSAQTVSLGNSGEISLGHFGFSTPTLVFENSGNVGSAGNRFDVYADTIVFNKTGGDAFILAGLNGGTVTVYGNSTNTLIDLLASYGGPSPVTMGAPGLTATEVVVDASEILLTGGITGSTIALTHTDDLDGDGLLTATNQVNLSGSGSVLGVRTATPNILLDYSDAPSVTLYSNRDAGVSIGGSGAGFLSVDSLQSDNETWAPLMIAAGGLSANHEIALWSGNLHLNGNLTAPEIYVNNEGDITQSAGLITANELHLYGEGSIGTPTSLLATHTPNLILLREGAAYIDNGAADLLLELPDSERGYAGASQGGIVRAGNLTIESEADIDIGAHEWQFTSSGTLDLGHVLFRADRLRLAHDGSLLNYQTPQVNTMVFGGAGNVGTASDPLATMASHIWIEKPTAANVYLVNGRAGGVTLGGANPAILSLSSYDGGFEDAAPITIDPAGLTAGNSLTLTASSLLLHGTLTGPNTVLNIHGPLSGAGRIVALNQLSLNGDGDIGSAMMPLLTQTPVLVLHRPTGAAFIDNGTQAFTLNPIVFTGGGWFTGGDLTLLGSLDVGANDLALISSGLIDLGNGTLRANRLTLAHDGALRQVVGSNLQMNTLVLGGGGSVGTTEAPLVISATQLIFEKTSGAEVVAENRRDGGVELGGTSHGNLRLASRDAAGSADAALVIGSDGFSSAGNMALSASAISLGGNLSGTVLRLEHSGALSGSGTLSATERLTLAGSGMVGTAATPQLGQTPLLVLEKPAGAVHFDNGAADLALHPIVFSGGGLFRSANFTLLAPLAVGSNSLELVSSGGLFLGGHGVSAGTLRLSGSGSINLSGGIAADQLVLGGTGDVSLSGANVPLVILEKPSGSVSIDHGGADVAIRPTAFGGTGSFAGRNVSLLGAMDVGSHSLTFSSSGILDLNSFSLRANRINFFHDGAVMNPGMLTATRVVLGGSGSTGASGTPFALSVTELELRKTGSANVFVHNRRDGGLVLFGTAGGGEVAISSLNTAGTSPETLTIGSAGLALIEAGLAGSSTSVGGSKAANVPVGTVNLQAGAIVLDGGITAGALTLSNAGQISGEGLLRAGSEIRLLNTGDVGSAAAPVFAHTPLISINKSSGVVYINNSGAPLALLPDAWGGGGGIFSGSLDLLAPINVGSNSLLLSTDGAMNLGAHTITGGAVTFNNGGDLFGTGLVTADTLTLGSDGSVGTIVTPLPFSGGPDDVVLNRPATGVFIGYFGGRGVALPANLNSTIAAESRQSSFGFFGDDNIWYDFDSDAALSRASRRAGGAAFRAIDARAELTVAAREQLQALGIYARALTRDELIRRERKEGVFVVVPEKESPQESDYQVVDARIDPNALQAVLRLANEAGLTGVGDTRLDEVARAMADTFEAFANVSDSIEADDYRAWLYQRGDRDARVVRGFVDTVRQTIVEIEHLGLTPQEVEVSKRQIYGNILHARLNADPDFLRQLVEGEPLRQVSLRNSIPAPQLAAAE
jgi:filamentous hemagglutinin family protein